MIPPRFHVWDDDLDAQPFPARELMRNELYIRPDTKEPMATIQTARGCPSQCVFCLTPEISGKRVRFRSPQNVLDEMIECYEKHHIRNFFFKADTFTINPAWVKEMCELIIGSRIYGKIEFTANSAAYSKAKASADTEAFAFYTIMIIYYDYEFAERISNPCNTAEDSILQ